MLFVFCVDYPARLAPAGCFTQPSPRLFRTYPYRILEGFHPLPLPLVQKVFTSRKPVIIPMVFYRDFERHSADTKQPPGWNIKPSLETDQAAWFELLPKYKGLEFGWDDLWVHRSQLERVISHFYGDDKRTTAPWPWGDHDTTLLQHLAAAAERFWKRYDPTDATTAPTNQTVSEWLQGRGVSSRIAETMASMLRPEGLKTGPRK